MTQQRPRHPSHEQTWFDDSECAANPDPVSSNCKMTSSTTLYTFILQISTRWRVSSVVVYGSWDNFREPYPLQRDCRAAYDIWRGSHRFRNILCDGEVDGPPMLRDGALKMGGTYWYYYRLNSDDEYTNPDEPVSTRCPMLPGHKVNVLEVPIERNLEYVLSKNGSMASLNSCVFTLDPNDKFTPLSSRRERMALRHPSRAKDMVDSNCPSDEEIRAALHTGAGTDAPVPAPEQTKSKLKRQHSVRGVFNSIKRVRSSGGPSFKRAAEMVRAMSSWSGRGTPRPHSRNDETPDLPPMPEHLQHLKNGIDKPFEPLTSALPEQDFFGRLGAVTPDQPIPQGAATPCSSTGSTFGGKMRLRSTSLSMTINEDNSVVHPAFQTSASEQPKDNKVAQKMSEERLMHASRLLHVNEKLISLSRPPSQSDLTTTPSKRISGSSCSQSGWSSPSSRSHSRASRRDVRRSDQSMAESSLLSSLPQTPKTNDAELHDDMTWGASPEDEFSSPNTPGRFEFRAWHSPSARASIDSPTYSVDSLVHRSSLSGGNIFKGSNLTLSDTSSTTTVKLLPSPCFPSAETSSPYLLSSRAREHSYDKALGRLSLLDETLEDMAYLGGLVS